ncbi:hypothetical protein [Vibrio hippocampi]|uniref:Uncharacterized protein n=1 Tax=Vibrio hippocampi TaxID=654686 RepID=A0ABN8DNH1_9VIBR|nr:hypothetical protein [Vibrio hippocampi]CAH0529541.1 hypothetical protein VHP8226_03295 [Vibrio hippocampi]
MLQQLVICSIKNFATDCQQLCVKHYPAIHNQGMTAHHLGLAFAKRLSADLLQAGYPSEHHSNKHGSNEHGSNKHRAIESTQRVEQANLYRVTSSLGTVWVITHHFINGNLNSRQQLIAHIQDWQSEYNDSIQPKDILLVVGDHWINRHSHSREMIHWWSGALPEELDNYRQQGVKLVASEQTFSKQLLNGCGLSPYYCHYIHPLHSTVTQKVVLRYAQFFSLIHP